MHEVQVEVLRGCDFLTHYYVAMERAGAHRAAGHPEVGMNEVEALEAEVKGEEAGDVVGDEFTSPAAAEYGREGVVRGQWGLGGCGLGFGLGRGGDGGSWGAP